MQSENERLTHPSQMPFYFAPPMPFHPEELCRQLQELEHVYVGIPTSNTNGRVALAKAIVAATANLIEGCLDDLISVSLSDLQVPQAIQDQVLERLRGLHDKTEFVKKRLAPMRCGWQAQDQPASEFVEGRMPNGTPSLRQLRNLIDHGDTVERAHLRLDEIEEFGNLARRYLLSAYGSLGITTPGWLRIVSAEADRPEDGAPLA